MRVFLITGFALDKRAFDLMDLPARSFRTLDLIPVRKGESLREYALRMAAGNRPGSGGHRSAASPWAACWRWKWPRPSRCAGVLLIASSTHPRQIRKRFKMWAPLASRMPEWAIRRIFTADPHGSWPGSAC